MATAEFKKWLEPDNLIILRGWARDGLLDKEIAKNIGINLCTFSRWQAKYPEIRKAIQQGRRPAVEELVDTAFARAMGKVKVVDTIEDIRQDADGREVRHIRRVTHELPPDTTLLIFLLKIKKGWNENRPLVKDPEAMDDGFLEALEQKAKEDWNDDTEHTEV